MDIDSSLPVTRIEALKHADTISSGPGCKLIVAMNFTDGATIKIGHQTLIGAAIIIAIIFSVRNKCMPRQWIAVYVRNNDLPILIQRSIYRRPAFCADFFKGAPMFPQSFQIFTNTLRIRFPRTLGQKLVRIFHRIWGHKFIPMRLQLSAKRF
ncbi:hypothetical protein C5615_38380 [Burkholderia cepacia]|uniref:Uncharacterized protein n=1 Tax=Burkholderia cepacia TaxID=292 RepID=A0A2S8HW93_BURCE|nr:hypothetical protein C5615_38380 [Burkholderia cepacia]